MKRMMKISVVTIVAMLAFSVVADAQKWVYRHIFSEGRASVRDAKGLWGYIDENSKMISPCKWKDAYDFKEGLAAVRDENGLYGFIDLDGKQVIPCQYKAVDSFYEGLAAVAIAKNSVYMWGYIDKTGKEIIPFNFKLALPFEHDGEPSSVKFCAKVGMNYASCSPFRVPIARLAAAQAAVEE